METAKLAVGQLVGALSLSPVRGLHQGWVKQPIVTTGVSLKLPIWHMWLTTHASLKLLIIMWLATGVSFKLPFCS